MGWRRRRRGPSAALPDLYAVSSSASNRPRAMSGQQGMRGCGTRARGQITTRNLPPDHHLLKNSTASGKRLVSSRDAGGRTVADDAELTHTEDFVGQSAASGKRPV